MHSSSQTVLLWNSLSSSYEHAGTLINTNVTRRQTSLWSRCGVQSLPVSDPKPPRQGHFSTASIHSKTCKAPPQSLQQLCHTSCWPGLNTFTPAPLLLSLGTRNPRCPSQEWKSNWKAQRSWEPRPMMALPSSSYFIISLTSILESSILCLLNPSSGVSLFVVALVFNSRLPSPLPPDSHIYNQVVTVSRKVWRFTGVTASLCFPTVCSRIFGQVWCFCSILLCFISWFFKTLQRLCFKKINNYHRESKECVSGKMMLVPSLLDFPKLRLRKK